VINLVVDILHLILFTIVFLIRIALFGILPLGELISEKCVYVISILVTDLVVNEK